LRRGKATVALRPDFAAVIDRKAIHVFLSPEGDCDGLYVSGQNGKAFSVRERQRGTSSVTLSYRVVGRRKDIRGERMKKVSVPRSPPAPEPELAVVAIKPHKARTPDFYGSPRGDLCAPAPEDRTNPGGTREESPLPRADRPVTTSGW
jgi:hypothetical protein